MTVEAALVCPMLCLVLCGIIQLTLGLYREVQNYSTYIKERTEYRIASEDMIRLENTAAELFRED